jgi:phosphopantetheinyl transferase
MSRAVLYLLRGWAHEPPTDTLLLRFAEDFTGLAPGALDTEAICRTDAGKPYYKTLPLEVSVSHTGRLFAALITEQKTGSIGLDVQYMRTVDLNGIAQRFFTEDECAYVEKTGEEGFYRIWTRKEALTKYLGLPLARTLKSASLAAADGLAGAVCGVRFEEMMIDSNVLAAIALRADCKVDLCSKEMNEKLF